MSIFISLAAFLAIYRNCSTPDTCPGFETSPNSVTLDVNMEEGMCCMVKACFDGVVSWFLYNSSDFYSISSSSSPLTYSTLSFMELGSSPWSTLMGSEVILFFPERWEVLDSTRCRISLTSSHVYLLAQSYTMIFDSCLWFSLSLSFLI